MKIVILGSTGLLGSAVGKYFVNKYGEDDIYLSYRNSNISYGKNSFYYNAIDFMEGLNNGKYRFPECDYIINCIGMIPQQASWSDYNAIKLNALLPWELLRYCNEHNTKLIHITTDCVFSGREGSYTEDSRHDALDVYGKSKSLGEINNEDNMMMLRTSIIGEEIHNNVSLISWVKSQKGKSVRGYTNHLWNGVTTLQYAKICDKIINEGLYQGGLYHVFSNTISKFELVHIINNHFNLEIEIEEFETDILVDRSLGTVKNLRGRLYIPTIRDQIAEI